MASAAQTVTLRRARDSELRRVVPTVFGSFRGQPPVVSGSIGSAALSLNSVCFLRALLSWQHGGFIPDQIYTSSWHCILTTESNPQIHPDPPLTLAGTPPTHSWQ
ncbi:hypothetical protein U0070_005921 [Myodes glareolus]|uniref:Uncharacterized protein n=1 Tax=Myodes glareolus TaxID=447135 RepID=A0AAW0HGL0_MYOGA